MAGWLACDLYYRRPTAELGTSAGCTLVVLCPNAFLKFLRVTYSHQRAAGSPKGGQPVSYSELEKNPLRYWTRVHTFYKRMRPLAAHDSALSRGARFNACVIRFGDFFRALSRKPAGSWF